jgi:dTMP kinase
MKKPLFIVIEGMDGVGKTTITKLLAKSLNAITYKIPPLELNSIRDTIDNSNKYAKFFYYLSATYYTSWNIQLSIKAGKSVVCDRYYQTTLSAYDDEVVNLVKREQIIDKLYKPDFCFLLTVSEEERIKRLNSRGYLSNDDIESIDNKVLREAQMSKYYQMDMIQIDTTGKTEQNIVDEIFKIFNF